MNSFGTHLCQVSTSTSTLPEGTNLTGGTGPDPLGALLVRGEQGMAVSQRRSDTMMSKSSIPKTKALKNGRQDNSREGFGGGRGGSVNHVECIWLVKLPSDYRLAFTRHFYGHWIPVKQPPPGQTKLLR